MGRIERIESATGYYHVMQRGAGKQILFEDEADYSRYFRKLEACKESNSFDIIAYCMMKNHIHLLIRTDDIGTLSTIMAKIGTSYAGYYNSKYDHVGNVFQGRFLSETISDEKYLLSCVRYIHNNPVKAGLCERDEYPRSSYNEYVGHKRVVNTDIVLGMFHSQKQFEEFSASLDDKVFIDVDSNDATCFIGQNIVRKHYGNEFENTLMVKRLCVEERNDIIREMKAAGLNNRQIELVTGVSRNIVRRI